MVVHSKRLRSWMQWDSVQGGVPVCFTEVLRAGVRGLAVSSTAPCEQGSDLVGAAASLAEGAPIGRTAGLLLMVKGY